MPDDLIALDVAPALEVALPDAAVRAAREFARTAWADETVRAYKIAWAEIAAWCKTNRREALPAAPETVEVFLHYLVRERQPPLSRSAIEQRACAICWAHDLAKHPSPTRTGAVKLALKAMRNKKGRRPKRRVAPATDDVLLQLVGVLDRMTARGKMRAALLLVGQGGAFRRSELVALDLADVASIEDGYRLLVRKGKTDQEGVGLMKGLRASGGELCPVRALREWLDVRGNAPGPLFKSISQGGAVLSNRLPAKKVAGIVKALARRAGVTADLSGHSLRAGFVTQARRAGADLGEIQRQTGHRDLDTLLEYIREEDPLTGNAAVKIAEERRAEARGEKKE